jgi:2',3'-cyclic-nucleotide 2'-phosphodiesterase/3'-nucleotidase
LNAELSASRPLRVVYEHSVTIRNILLNELANMSPLYAKPVPNWRLAQMPDTSFVFETAPEAAQFLKGLEGLSIEPLGLTATGFGRFRLQM